MGYKDIMPNNNRDDIIKPIFILVNGSVSLVFTFFVDVLFVFIYIYFSVTEDPAYFSYCFIVYVPMLFVF